MLLSVEDLRVSYGNIKALHGLSFQIEEREIVCIIGANGAGKSTTLKAISRMVPVEAGSKMTYAGNDLLRYPADKVVSELGISHVPEGRRLFENLTITENLKLATFARKDKDQIQLGVKRVFSIFPRLEERQNQKSGTLSGGEQQMLAVGRLAPLSRSAASASSDRPASSSSTRSVSAPRPGGSVSVGGSTSRKRCKVAVWPP